MYVTGSPTLLDIFISNKYNKNKKFICSCLVYLLLSVAYYEGGGIDMATSSITKDFYIKDPKALERLKQELDKKQNTEKQFNPLL